MGTLLFSILRLHVSQKLNVLRYMLCNISDFLFIKKLHCGVLVHEFVFSLCNLRVSILEVFLVFVMQHQDPLREIICTMFLLISLLKIV